jgi:serine/threonine-protein kinase
MRETPTRQASGDDWLAMGVTPPAGRSLDDLVGRDFGVYHIDSFLGAGAMGRVYLAHHYDLRRPCALKILLPERAERDRDYVERFQAEGRAAASLVHPNIVTIHALGQQAGLHYLEMEYVPGRSLRHLLEDAAPLSPLRASEIALRIAEGLARAHGAGVVHRDLKPDNVLMSFQGVPKLTDFGLCKAIPASGSEGPEKQLAGTPHYMAPELFAHRAATPASDVYALGVSLYVMLSGTFPFDSATVPGLAALVTSASPRPLRELNEHVPLEMAECVARMLDKTPGNRPSAGSEAVALLETIVGKARDLGDLVGEAFRHDKHVEIGPETDGFRVRVHLPNGRQQVVNVRESEHAMAEQLLVLSSVCGAARPEYFERALRLNGEMLHGGVSIVPSVDGPMFRITDTYPRTTVDSEEIRRSAHEIAVRADAFEQWLSTEDRY